ncbi:MAG: hypothetical protein WBB01_07475 [Phormidesmis sp.]
MQSIQAEDYPYVEELLTDNTGQVLKVVLQLKDYHRLIEALEDEGLYRAMQAVQGETPIGLEAALEVLDADES